MKLMVPKFVFCRFCIYLFSSSSPDSAILLANLPAWNRYSYPYPTTVDCLQTQEGYGNLEVYK
jgi:hypothetical protein